MVLTIFKQMVRSIVTKKIQNDMISTSCFILGMVFLTHPLPGCFSKEEQPLNLENHE